MTGTLGRQFGLTERQAFAVIEVHHEGRTEAETAEAMGISTAAVCRLLRRAADRLEQQGLPRPNRAGVGSRAELLASLPDHVAYAITGQQPVGVG